MFICFFNTKQNDKRENIPKMCNKTMVLLNNEIIFSGFQLNKVLDFYGLTYQELYDTSSTISHKKRTEKYKEKTNVLSYYILKTICIFHIDNFLEWCISHNGGFSINFGKSKNVLEKNLDKYCLFIIEHYKSPEFLMFLDNIKQIKINIKSFEYQTMRMSVFG
jgi:hypothetical protein